MIFVLPYCYIIENVRTIVLYFIVEILHTNTFFIEAIGWRKIQSTRVKSPAFYFAHVGNFDLDGYMLANSDGLIDERMV